MVATAALAWSCAHTAPSAPPPVATSKPVVAPSSGPVAPAPLELVPPDVARAGVIATFVIPSLERSLQSGVTLVKQATPLPLDAVGVRDMLLAQAGLGPEVARHLDISSPIAGAVVLNGAGGAGVPLSAFSFAVRTPGDALALLTVLGRTVARRGSAVQIENAGGERGWFLPRGTEVVFADTDEALVRAGALALEARRQINDDISVLLHPEMVARAAGTSIETAIEILRRGVEERATARGAALGPEASRQLRIFASYLGEISTAELAVDLDATRGASVLARLRPKAGSRLEKLARETATIAVDPGLGRSPLDNDPAGLVLTSAYGAATLEQLGRIRGRLPGDRPRAALLAGRLLDVLSAGLTGQLSMIGRLQPALSTELVLPIRDATGAALIEPAVLASDRDALTAVVRAVTLANGAASEGVKVLKVRRETVSKTKAVHATLEFALSARVDAAASKLLGTKATEVFLAVVGGDRVAVTAGPGARGRLAEIAGAPRPVGKAAVKTTPITPAATIATKTTSVIADAVAVAGARSLFFFLDLRQVVFLVAATGADSRLRMLSSSLRSPMPLFGGATGDGQGQSFTLDLTIPPACLNGIGTILQAALLTRN